MDIMETSDTKKDVVKRKRRSSLEVLVDKTIKNRKQARKLRGLTPMEFGVDILNSTVTVLGEVVVCNDVPSFIEYLELENKKSAMLKESTITKRFDSKAFNDLSVKQLECVTPFIFDETEKEEGTEV